MMKIEMRYDIKPWNNSDKSSDKCSQPGSHLQTKKSYTNKISQVTLGLESVPSITNCPVRVPAIVELCWIMLSCRHLKDVDARYLSCRQ